MGESPMSQIPEPNSETSQTTIQTRVLSEKEIAQIAREVVEHPEKYPEESKYLLKISTWYRQGSSYDDTARFEVIYGEVETVVVNEWDEGYPYRRGKDYIVIPKTLPVVLIWRNRWDYGEDRGKVTKVFVFTKDGWKSILVEG